MGYSTTYTGIIIVALGMLAKWLGVPAIDDKSVETTISTILQIVGMLTAIRGRYNAGGVTPLGFKTR